MAGNSSNNSSDSELLHFDCPIPDEPRASFIVRAVCWALIILFSVAGNILVCRGAISRRHRPFTYYLIINLAVGELVITFCQPFMFHYTVKPFSWIWGEFMCTLVTPLGICGFQVVTFTLAAIAIYRCIMIVRPYRSHPTLRVTYLVITVSWILGLAFALPSAVSSKVVHYPGTCRSVGTYRCEEDFKTEQAMYLYTMLLFTLQVAVPLAILVISYGIVICRVKSHIRRTREESIDVSEMSRRSTVGSIEFKQPPLKDTLMIHLPKSPESPDQYRNPNLNDDRNSERKKMTRLENDVLNMIYIIIVVFFIFYTPAQIMYVLLQDNILGAWKYIYILYYYLSIMHAVPSALHPILYGTMSNVITLNIWRCEN